MKFYAFVSDYVRAHALYTQGGIYLDTDVELKGSLDPCLNHQAFSGFEKKGLPFTAVWGSEKNHIWPKKILDLYDNSSFDGVTLVPNTSLVSEILESEFDIDPTRDELQIGKEGIAIYPSSMFCLDIPFNLATHHFEGSWLGESDRHQYKYWINRDWRVDVLVDSIAEGDLDSTLGNLFRRIGPVKVLLSLFRIAIKTVAIQIKRF
jgi:hypothetical protein